MASIVLLFMSFQPNGACRLFNGEFQEVWMKTGSLLLSSLPRGPVRSPGNGCNWTGNGGNPCVGSRKVASGHGGGGGGVAIAPPPPQPLTTAAIFQSNGACRLFNGEFQESILMKNGNLLLSSLPRGRVRPPGNGCNWTGNGGNHCVGSKKIASRHHGGVVAPPLPS
ncbi:hypothetical protein L6452_43127 [Arctium lappa]|uniref:Uncharacterized protein n=1 Tax=Arctium lappa TaxID=4217 RepID=A0ACB8XJI6_ARCLA|nr:hypothetical protein L6452_43127 [Arctium lappa]